MPGTACCRPEQLVGNILGQEQLLARQVFVSVRFAHISLVFAGLMWVLPFLHSRHYPPIGSFYQEWWAVLLGLLAMPLLAARRFWQQPEIPRIALLPIGLSLLVLLQFAAGRVAYLDQALLAAMCLLWAALLAMLGHRLREEFGLPALCTALAACLLLGAESSALVGVLQHFFQCTRPVFLDYLRLDNLPGSLAGNLAQPNHFANYTTLGLVSLGLLRLRWQLRIWQVVLLAAPLLFVLTLSGSRSPWLYLLCVAAMAFLWQRRERKGGCDAAGNPPAYPLRVDKSCLPLLHYSLALLLGFGLMHFVVQTSWLAGCSGGLASGERLIVEAGGFVKEVGSGSGGGSGGGSIRLQIWREAWLIFSQFPLLGAGFGQFAWQHFQFGPVLRNINISGMVIHSHNLVLQVAAEMGLAGLFVLLGTLALWFRQARLAQRTRYHWWGYGLLAVLAIHSLLEFPLWYVYFLGVAALTLGIFDTTTYCLKPGNPGSGFLPEREARVSYPAARGGLKAGLAAIVLLFGVLIMARVWQGYREMERLSNSAPPADVIKKGNYNWQPIRDRLAALQGEMPAPLLRPHVEGLLGEAGWNHVADRGALNERVMRYAPGSPAVYRHALLLARFGQQAEARAQIERAIWAYPEDFPESRDTLRVLAGRDADPSRYPALLEFALQKYEEQQHAVHIKP